MSVSNNFPINDKTFSLLENEMNQIVEGKASPRLVPKFIQKLAIGFNTKSTEDGITPYIQRIFTLIDTALKKNILEKQTVRKIVKIFAGHNLISDNLFPKRLKVECKDGNIMVNSLLLCIYNDYFETCIKGFNIDPNNITVIKIQLPETSKAVLEYLLNYYQKNVKLEANKREPKKHSIEFIFDLGKFAHFIMEDDLFHEANEFIRNMAKKNNYTLNDLIYYVEKVANWIHFTNNEKVQLIDEASKYYVENFNSHGKHEIKSEKQYYTFIAIINDLYFFSPSIKEKLRISALKFLKNILLNTTSTIKNEEELKKFIEKVEEHPLFSINDKIEIIKFGINSFLNNNKYSSHIENGYLFIGNSHLAMLNNEDYIAELLKKYVHGIYFSNYAEENVFLFLILEFYPDLEKRVLYSKSLCKSKSNIEHLLNSLQPQIITFEKRDYLTGVSHYSGNNSYYRGDNSFSIQEDRIFQELNYKEVIDLSNFSKLEFEINNDEEIFNQKYIMPNKDYFDTFTENIHEWQQKMENKFPKNNIEVIHLENGIVKYKINYKME